MHVMIIRACLPYGEAGVEVERHGRQLAPEPRVPEEVPGPGEKGHHLERRDVEYRRPLRGSITDHGSNINRTFISNDVFIILKCKTSFLVHFVLRFIFILISFYYWILFLYVYFCYA